MELKVFLFLGFFFALPYLGSSQIELEGPCPVHIKVEQHFDLSKYLGLWFEARHYRSFFDEDDNCVSMRYSQDHNGNNVKALKTFYNKITMEKAQTIDGVAPWKRTKTDETEGKFNFTFSLGALKRAMSVYVVSTNYVSYSVEWSCSSIITEDGNITSSQYAWVLSRDLQLKDEDKEKVKKVFTMNKLSMEHLSEDSLHECKAEYINCGHYCITSHQTVIAAILLLMMYHFSITNQYVVM